MKFRSTLAFALVLSIAACGGKKSEEGAGSATASGTAPATGAASASAAVIDAAPAAPAPGADDPGFAAHHETKCGNDAASCTIAGMIYFAGRGVPADPVKGKLLLEKGCKDGDGKGCEALAIRLVDGNDMPADPAAAVVAATRACELGDAYCGILGQFHAKSIGGLTPDPAKELALFEKSCAGGQQKSCALALERKSVPQ